VKDEVTFLSVKEAGRRTKKAKKKYRYRSISHFELLKDLAKRVIYLSILICQLGRFSR